jgi:hypothetical protein
VDTLNLEMPRYSSSVLPLTYIHPSAQKWSSRESAKGRATPGSTTPLAEGWLWGLRGDPLPSTDRLRVERSS